jgi:hypothetical protein
MLAGRVEGSAPYGWTRNKESITGYVEDTMGRLGGQGLPKTDLDALVTFVSSLPSPVHPTADDASIARGRELFSSERTDCQSCHPGGDTDHRGHLLDMSQANSYDTPSLRSVVATAPYFHDGRYPSLDALLSDRKSHMGRAFELSGADRRALRDYLESL